MEKASVQGISVIIPTYNGSARLPKVLSCLASQEMADNIAWEVVLIDNASTDNTQEIAKQSWTNKKVPLNIVYEKELGRSSAVRSGLQNAKYDIVCTVDDDNWVEKDYIRNIYTIMNDHPEVGICGCHGIGEYEIHPPHWIDKFQDAYAIGPQGNKSGYVSLGRGFVYGACQAIRKKGWFDLFNNQFKFYLSDRKGKSLASGGDQELGLAFILMGYKLWYADEIHFKHFMPEGRLNWKYLKKLFKAFGQAQVVTDQYSIFINRHSNRRRKIFSNYYLTLCYSFYRMISKFPKYVFHLMFTREGSKNILTFLRAVSYFNYVLNSRKSIIGIRMDLKNARWRNLVNFNQ